MTRLRTHGPIEFDKDGTCRTKCHWCKTDVVLPISIRPGTQIEAERYYVRK